MSSVGIRDLHEELIVQIFEEFELKDLLNCSLTCRLFHDIIRDALVLQYHIELAAAGVEDCGNASKLTTAERLAELKRLEEGWTNLRFRQRRKIAMPISDVWELFGGVLACGITSHSEEQMPETRGLSFVQLPSLTCRSMGRTWEHRDLGVHIRDFAIDPAQDLAVLLAHPVVMSPHGPTVSHHFVIHLRAMSTGESHSEAEHPALTYPTVTHLPRCSFIIQVMGQFLAILFRVQAADPRSRDQLYIWNWKTGDIAAFLIPSPTDEAGFNSFSFLSPRHFVVSRFKRHTSILYSLAPTTQSPTLDVYDFLSLHTTPCSTPRLVRSFQFPQVYAVMTSMLTRSDPSPTCSPLPSKMDARPFRTASSSNLMTVSMQFIPQVNDLRTYVLFVHHSTLLDGLMNGRLEEPSEITVPWDAWGPRESRLLPTLYNEDTWVCYVHGTRYVRLEPVSEQVFEGRTRLRMLDFNPRALKSRHHFHGKGMSTPLTSQPAQITEADLSCDVVVDATVIPTDRRVFTEDVVTSLPYRDVRSGETFTYDAVMIDEDCLVGLPRELHPRIDEMEFLCF